MSNNILTPAARIDRRFRQLRVARTSTLTFALAALLAVSLIVGLRGSLAQSSGSQPDYSTVNDFMNGGTHLLRDDDLVMTYNYLTASSEFRGALFTAGTSDSQPTFLNNNQHTIPQGPGCADSGGCNYDYNQFVGNRPATGRFFQTERDTTVHYPVLLDGYPYLVSLDGSTTNSTPPAAGLTWKSAHSINFVTGANSFLSGVGDFNGDGYDDLLMGYSDSTQYPPGVPPKLRIATAANLTDSTKPLNDPGQGFNLGPEFTFDFAATSPPVYTSSFADLAVGDFNGDQQPEIAVVYILSDGTLQLQIFGVDPAKLSISTAGALQLYQLGGPVGSNPISITVGKFTADDHKQLIVAFQPSPTTPIVVQVVDFNDGSLQPNIASTLNTTDVAGDTIVKVKAGRFDWSSPYDQVAYMSSSTLGTSVALITVDPATEVASKSATAQIINDSAGLRFFGRDIAIGNFDHMKQSSVKPTEKERDPDLQMAVIGIRVNISNGDLSTASLAIFEDSGSSTLNNTVYSVLDSSYFAGNQVREMSIASGDLQGRSLRLGNPTRLTIENYSYPSVITAVPPMHVDYIIPAAASAPTVLNISAVPDSFWSQYQVQKENKTDTQVTDDQSHSFGFQEQVSGFAQIGGDPSENAGFKIEDTVTATQDIKNINNQIHGQFQGVSYGLTDQTGWGDSVSYTSTTINIWIYPVIGKTVCSKSDPTRCGPLTIQFSAPSGTDVGTAEDGTLKEWYQPVWEPGNIFSYPANFAQLNYANTIARLDNPLTFFTDSSQVQESIGWKAGLSADSTVGQEKTFSGSNDLAISGRLGDKDTSGIGGSLKFNANGSDAFSNLTLSQNSSNTSTGLTFNKPGTFASPGQYAYAFQPVIYGSQAPLNIVDQVDLNTNIVTFNALQSAFIVDPTAKSSGGWWSGAYSKPDIALNHPLRWTSTKGGLPTVGQLIPSNCLALGGSGDSTGDCLSLNSSTPSSPWSSEFHFMRGFFISNAATPGKGPQLQITDEGTKLTLQTRVYNYSLMPMPDTSQVHVRFYAIPWRVSAAGTNPANTATGNMILIDEVTLDPIQNFDSSESTPNWSLAKAKDWDTTGLGGQYFTFAVVAWAQDGNTLVSEMPSHGLNQLPGAPNSYASFSDLTKLEELVDNPLKQSPTDPDQVSFSNNIGFYNSVFYVEPVNSPPASAKTKAGGSNLASSDVKLSSARTKAISSDLAGSDVKLSSNTAKLGQTIQVSAELKTAGRPISTMNVHFYDGDPNAGGKVFDVERIPHIKANDRYEVSVNYRAKACGAHRLFVKAGRGLAYEVTVQSQPLQVECPTPVCTSQVCMRSAQYYALNLDRLPQGVVTVPGRGLGTGVSTGNTAQMRILLQGGTAAQQRFTQQFVATQLSLLGQPGGTQAALGSNLLCYGVNFQPTQLGTGAVLAPSMTLGELFEQARIAGRSGGAADQRMIANLLQLLNGDDPQGRCR